MRDASFFVECIGESLNSIIGHPKGHLVHRSMKKKVASAMLVSGVHRLEPFTTSVEFHFTPRITRSKSGKLLKKFDAINFATTYKAIEDCFVQAGLLPDDSPTWVDAVHCYKPIEGDPAGILVIVRESEGRTE